MNSWYFIVCLIIPKNIIHSIRILFYFIFYFTQNIWLWWLWEILFSVPLLSQISHHQGKTQCHWIVGLHQSFVKEISSPVSAHWALVQCPGFYWQFVLKSCYFVLSSHSQQVSLHPANHSLHTLLVHKDFLTSFFLQQQKCFDFPSLNLEIYIQSYFAGEILLFHLSKLFMLNKYYKYNYFLLHFSSHHNSQDVLEQDPCHPPHCLLLLFHLELSAFPSLSAHE